MENTMNQKTMMNNGAGAEILNMYLPEFMNLKAAHICKAEGEDVYMFNGCYISLIYMANGNIQDYLYRQLCRFDARTGKMLTPMFNECGALINFIDPDTGKMLVYDQSELVKVFVHTPYCQHGFNIYKTNINAGGPQMNTIIPTHTSAQTGNNYGNMSGNQGQFMNNGFVAAGLGQPGYNPMQYQQALQGCLNPMGYNNIMAQGGNMGRNPNNPMNANIMNPNGGMAGMGMTTMSYEDMNKQILSLTQSINGIQVAINSLMRRIDDTTKEQAKIKSCSKFDLPLENGPKVDKLEAEVLKNKRLKEEGSNSKIKNYMDFPESFKNGEPHDPFLKEILKIKEDDKKSDDNDKSVDNKHTGNK